MQFKVGGRHFLDRNENLIKVKGREKYYHALVVPDPDKKE